LVFFVRGGTGKSKIGVIVWQAMDAGGLMLALFGREWA